MLTPQEVKRLFSQVIRHRDTDINLVEAALLIAAGQGSDTQLEVCLAQIAALAHRVTALLETVGVFDPKEAPLFTIHTINRVLFEEEGFYGNREDYYCVDNSCLDHVLSQRTGIPITMSIMYMEVARLVGLPLQAIGLPGHFVVGYRPQSDLRIPALIIDPFNGGELLTLEDCAARVHSAYGYETRFDGRLAAARNSPSDDRPAPGQPETHLYGIGEIRGCPSRHGYAARCAARCALET